MAIVMFWVEVWPTATLPKTTGSGFMDRSTLGFPVPCNVTPQVVGPGEVQFVLLVALRFMRDNV